jgi:hypothetical protein
MEEGDVRRLSAQESINTAISKMTELLAGPAQMISAMIDSSWILYGIMGAIGTIVAVNLVNGIADFGMGIVKAIPKLLIWSGIMTEGSIASITAASAFSLGLSTIAIVAGIAAVMGAFSSAKSKAAPGLAVGGTVTGAGSIMVGENGPEILSAQPGATVTPLNKLNAATQQSSPAIDYDKMAQAMSRVQVQTNLDGVNVSRKLQTPMGIATRKL